MSKTITSGGVTFMDLTDNRKLEAYITSNLPTTQIYNQNAKTYTPDWSTTNLQLSVDVFLDSTEVTTDTKTFIIWYKRIGTQSKTQVSTGANLIINSNQLIDDNSIITYICEATYNDTATNPPAAHTEIIFTRVDTGLNGSDGTDAPAVVAQYSADGTTNWTSTLNATTHKYIRHSYDGGKTWSVAIKMVGEDGTSVKIVGTATSATKVSGTDYYTLVYSSASITSAELGDAYLYDGDLYVCADSRDGHDYFINVGNIQGPSGNDGKSSYVFIRYATDANGSNMSTSPTGKTYMGVYTSETNVAPTTASVYTWSKFVGDNAKRIALSGDSQVFKISQSNAITPSTIKVTAQAFNTTITNWTYSTNGGQTFLSTVPDGVSRNGNIVTVTGSSLASNSLTIKASDGTIEDVFTVYKAFDGTNGNPGSPGAPAPITFLTNENVTFSANAQGQITGTTITSNVVAYNGTTKVIPTIGTISGVPTGMTITSSTITASNEVMLTITIANNSTLGSTSNNMGVVSIPVTSPVSTVLYLTWSKVNTGATGSPGAPAYTATLTNESHIFAGDVSNAIAGSATTQVLAYKGTAAQTVTISSVNGKAASTADTDTGIAGLKFKCSALSGTSPTITFTCTTSFVSANGTIPIVFTVDGVSFTKIFTYSIAFKGGVGDPGSPGQPGSPGTPSTSYWLISSASVVQKTATGTIAVTPSTLTFTGKSQTGLSAPTDYACRWIIAYSTDGTNYTNLYTSSANETSKSITVATTYKAIRARMYLAGGTSTLLDEQIVPIVSDGTMGANAVSLQIYAPKGYLLKKDLESLPLQTFACEGSTVITSGAEFQWSQLIDNVWTDIDKATEETYTVTQADVLKAKSYRCVMEYKTQTYIATATVQDATDIYESVMYVSSNIIGDDYYWVLYTLVYTEAGEVDPLLGPITISAPSDPVVGDYWYAVNTTNAAVTLKKYDGASWVDSTDTQSFSYSWDIINDGSTKIPLSGSAKVKVISRHNFTATATVACEVSSLEEGLVTQSSLSLTDASDPIVSDTEPTVTVNGQIWIKPNENGTYLMFIWDESTSSWISGDMDTRSKVYTSRPSSYNDGDLWITATDTDHGSYLQGTLLQAQASRTTYNAADWSPTLRYDKELAEMQEDLDKLSQYISINNDGLRIRAKNSSGELSPFSSLFTSTELAFYQNSKKLLTLANNQLTAPKIIVEDSLDVEGSISLGALQIVIEDNGSFSFAVER